AITLPPSLFLPLRRYDAISHRHDTRSYTLAIKPSHSAIQKLQRLFQHVALHRTAERPAAERPAGVGDLKDLEPRDLISAVAEQRAGPGLPQDAGGPDRQVTDIQQAAGVVYAGGLISGLERRALDLQADDASQFTHNGI